MRAEGQAPKQLGRVCGHMKRVRDRHRLAATHGGAERLRLEPDLSLACE